MGPDCDGSQRTLARVPRARLPLLLPPQKLDHLQLCRYPRDHGPVMPDLCFMNPEMFKWNIKSAKPKWPRCVLLPFPSSSPFYPNHSHG